MESIGDRPQKLVQPRLVNRHLAGLEAGDPVGVDVDAPHVGPQLRKPRRRDEAHVAGPDYGDRLSVAHEAHAAYVPMRCSDSGRIASIWRLFSDRSTVFETQ